MCERLIDDRGTDDVPVRDDGASSGVLIRW